MTDRNVRIALIGSGFMGRAYALALRAAERTFDLGASLILELLCDQDEQSAAQAAPRLDFSRWSDDWRSAVADPAVDLVVIATPNLLHAPIALAAIAAGKAVHCEKPLATRVEDAVAMTRAAEAAGAVTAMGFTYLHNPMIKLARELVDSGEIGTVTSFRGAHAEDFMASPEAPFGWRCEADQAGGALADLGSHIIAIAQEIVGEIVEAQAHLQTVHRHRRDFSGVVREVPVDDQMDALVRFAGGACGTLSASWLASGRKMGLGFEVSGTKGSIAFTQERFNELQLYRVNGSRTDGFTTIAAGPDHGDYAAFCPAPGHQLGYNDLKTIEVRATIDAVAGRPSSAVTFAAGLDVDLVADAIRRASSEAKWVAMTKKG